jgi:type I restriction enzyme S subunit
MKNKSANNLPAWEYVPFKRAIREATAGQPKLKSKEYRSSGSIPVIDQGQEYLAGYTDDSSMLFRGELPVIVFGDHTRIFKYVDHPFCLGADGSKVLITEPTFVPKFLYYYLLSVQLPNLGYSRHSKVLREVTVPYPPVPEQVRIVEILDQADALRKKRVEADKIAERILLALFNKMFGDPATNPMGWETKRLDSAVQIGTQLVDPNQPEFMDLPHIGGENIESTTGVIVSPRLVRDSDLRSAKFFFNEKHILYSKIRPYLNKVTYPKFRGVCSADIYPLLPDETHIRPWFLIASLRANAFLNFASIHSERLRIPKINSDQLGFYQLMLPPIEEQAKFERAAQSIVGLDEARTKSGHHIAGLLASLSHRAFAGELTSKWREKAHKNPQIGI